MKIVFVDVRTVVIPKTVDATVSPAVLVSVVCETEVKVVEEVIVTVTVLITSVSSIV